MDKSQAARDIITATLPHVPFDGWTMAALARGAKDAGYDQSDVTRVLPAGAIDAVDMFFTLGDQAMHEALEGRDLSGMKLRQKIALAVRLRIEQHGAHKEALRRALAFHALPLYLHRGLRALYLAVDSLWYAVGDSSTDFNFYTKRATLAAVYSATLLFWLNDESKEAQATWDYLDRRIENVMQFEKFKQKIRSFIP